VNLHWRQANCRCVIFRCPEFDRVAQVAFRTEMVFAVDIAFRGKMRSDLVSDVCVGLVEQNPYLCASTMSGDC